MSNWSYCILILDKAVFPSNTLDKPGLDPGTQGASRVAPGKSGVHSSGEGERGMLSSHGRGIAPQDALKKDS